MASDLQDAQTQSCEEHPEKPPSRTGQSTDRLEPQMHQDRHSNRGGEASGDKV